MKIEGGCHCGAIRYEVEGDLLTHALCHCTDCRRSAGAPMVAWTMYRAEAVRTTKGTPKIYASSEHGRRHFCADCGTGLFYANDAILPGIVDLQSATYDDPNLVPARAHVQTAERISWMARAHELPEFERYPPPAP
ncbi:MAG: GFA family protein [Tagaea sp.]|nr:GFA family protein [Tagaea sp.]